MLLYFNWFVANIHAVKKLGMTTIGSVLLLVWLATGCATSNVATRKQERPAVYAALTPEQCVLVDSGHIEVGLPMDAVYIAWGKPSQIVNGQSSSGAMTTTWIYTGTSWQEQRYWNYRYYPGRGRYAYPEPYLDYQYVPLSYLAAEVVFENGIVKSWKHVTPPGPY